MKIYYNQYNIGKSKYVVKHHDGKKIHKDGSRFFDIAIFSNKKKRDSFIKDLEADGYTHRDMAINTYSGLKNRIKDSDVARWVMTFNEPVVINKLSRYGNWKENEDGSKSKSKKAKKTYNVYLRIINGSLTYAASKKARFWNYVELGLPFSKIVDLKPHMSKTEKMSPEEYNKAECQKFINRCHPNIWNEIKEECKMFIETGDEEHLPSFIRYNGKCKFVSIKGKMGDSYAGKHTIEALKKAMDENGDYRTSFSAMAPQGRDRSFSVATSNGETRAWFSSEFPGCGNGDYYLLINPTTAVFCERD